MTTVIPFKRLGNRSSLPIRSWANARNAMAFASILLIILLYVIWTSTGNSTTTSTSSTTLMLSSSASLNTRLNSGANKNSNKVRAPSSSLINNNIDAHIINNNNNNINNVDNIIENNAAAAAAVALAPILFAAKIAGAENFIVADDHKNSKKFNVIFDKDDDDISHSDNAHILYGNSFNFDGGGGIGIIDSHHSLNFNQQQHHHHNHHHGNIDRIDGQFVNIGDDTVLNNGFNKGKKQNNNNNMERISTINKNKNIQHHHRYSHYKNQYPNKYPNNNNNHLLKNNLYTNKENTSSQNKNYTHSINNNNLIIKNYNNDSNHSNINNNSTNININKNNNNYYHNKNNNNNINNNILPKTGKTNSQLKVEQSIAAAAAARASKPAVNLIYKKPLPPHATDKKRNIVKVVPETGIVNESMDICNENFEDNRQYIQNRPRIEYNHLPIIYFVTPTYPRREQIPELTRLGQTLMHVPRIHWIVADDFDACNSNLDFLLNTFGVPYTHISSPMPDIYRAKSPNPRGVANRRAALNWIRNGNHKHGVLYFGDDDNTFDLKLFSEIRDTKKVSMFPVGLIGLYAVSAPVVKDGKIIGFFDSWPAKRKWPVDMAGFAVNLQYLSQHPNATMPYRAGYEEDAFLRSISLKIEDIEPKAANCTEILVWHTQTQKSKAPTVRIESKYIYDGTSSLAGLFRELEALNVSHHSDTTGVKAQISRDGKARPISYFFR